MVAHARLLGCALLLALAAAASGQVAVDTRCRPGTYKLANGTCIACPAGSSQPLYDQTTCVACPAGHYSNEGSPACFECEPGSYASTTGAARECTWASAGQYVPRPAATAPLDCPPGTYSDGEGYSFCWPCDNYVLGKYQDQAGQTSCKACPTGKYTEEQQSTSCKTPTSDALVPGHISIDANRVYVHINFANAVPDNTYRISATLSTWSLAQQIYSTMPNGAQEAALSAGAESTSFDYDNLPAGTLFNFEAKLEKLDNSVWSTVSTLTLDKIKTRCSCDPALGDPPGKFQVKQDKGRMYFTWSDYSRCESAFVITRDGTEIGNFVPRSQEVCHASFDYPRTLYDDIIASNLKAGQTYQYCIRAYSTDTYRWLASSDTSAITGTYTSPPTCVRYQIKWEAGISARVVLTEEAGSVPVPNTNVSLSLVDPDTGKVYTVGSALTDRTGMVSVYDFLPWSELTEMQVELGATKTTADIVHKYTCNGIPCTKQRAMLRPFVFDTLVTFVDVSTAPVIGKVVLPMTLDVNKHSDTSTHCPIRAAKVCARDVYEDTVIACADTIADGTFAVPVPMGASVFFEVSYGENHTFVRVGGTRQPDGKQTVTTVAGTSKVHDFYVIDGSKATQDILFADATMANFTAVVAGGKCGRVLGTSTLRASYADCTNTFEFQLLNKGTDSFMLPMHNLNIEFKSLTTQDTSDPERDAHAADVLAYFQAVNMAKQLASLFDGPQSLRWEYHPIPELKTVMLGVDDSKCGFPALKQNVITAMTVYVTEKFWDGQQSCTWLDGSVFVTNLLGESLAIADTLVAANQVRQVEGNLLKICREGCDLPIVVTEAADDNSQPTNARVELTVMTGSPEDIATVTIGDKSYPFAKLFTAKYTAAGNRVVLQSTPVVVTGHKKLSEQLTMDFPSYFPLTILYDPPGGSSYAFYEAGTATVQVNHDEYVSFKGGNTLTGIGAGATAQVEACLGLGVEMCNEVIELGVATELSTSNEGSRADLNAKRNTDKSTTVSIDFSLSTGGEAYLPSDHIIVTPTLTVKFIETAIIEFNATACVANKRVDTTWALDNSNTKSYALKTYRDLVNLELPTLEASLVEEKAKLSSATGDELTKLQARITKLEEAIAGWKKIVKHIDDQLKAAELGTLKPLTGLMPEQLVDSVRELADTSKVAKEAKADLETINAINFQGGGQEYSYSESSDSSNTATSGIEYEGSTSYERAVAFEASTAGLYISTMLDVNDFINTNSAHLKETGTETSSALGFVLADEDEGDEFYVKVYRDPIFNTFVFHTFAGASKCIWEPGTYAREQPRIDLLVQPAGPVLPFTPAVYRVRVSNAAREGGFYDLYARDGAGTSVTVDGFSLEVDHEFENMAPYSAQEIVIQVEQWDLTKSAYNITVGFRSHCEREFEKIKDNTFTTQEVMLSPTFMQACPRVKFVGELARDNTFVINNDNKDTPMMITVSNPDFTAQKWASSTRLEAVELQYRRKGSQAWKVGLNATGAALNFKDVETTFGYATQYWGLPSQDGKYEIRVRTRCNFVGADVPDGVNFAVSDVISGVVDRKAPSVFDVPSPADGVYRAGGVVELKFSEAIDCREPVAFAATIAPASLPVVNVVPKCSADGSSLIVPFAGAVDLTQLTRGESKVKVTVTGVADLAGNAATDQSWEFTYEDKVVTTTASTTTAAAFWDTTKYTLAAGGGKYAVGGVSKRFTGGFDAALRLKVISDVSYPFTQCFTDCNADSNCGGVFVWSAGAFRCHLLKLGGVATLMATTSDTYSFLKQSEAETTAFNAFSLVAGGGTNAINGKSLRIDSAFDANAQISTLDGTTEAKCAVACNSNASCKAFFFWAVNRTSARCYLLNSAGTGTVATGTNSKSYIKA